VYERALIDPAVRATVSGHARSTPALETGGILLGHPIDNTTIHVTRASPPGPRARHGPFSFSRDTPYLQRYLDDVHNRSKGAEDYVGEWHVHHALDAGPSYIDRRSLWRIARRSNYATQNPVLIILESTPQLERLRIYGFLATPRKRYREITIDMPARIGEA
jgi:integrative and conjugative element protein (TIGR02256 family)